VRESARARCVFSPSKAEFDSAIDKGQSSPKSAATTRREKEKKTHFSTP
jgi:hypothetical protein